MSETPAEPSLGALSRLEIVGQLRAHLIDIMPDAETLWATQPVNSPSEEAGRPSRPPMTPGGLLAMRRRSPPPPVVFRGHLAMDSTQAFKLLRDRFATLGYTPLLRQEEGYDLVIAIRHLFPSLATRGSSPLRWVPNLVMLLLTLVTTTLVGVLFEQGEALARNPQLLFRQPWLIATGIPYSLTIMSILGVHELAHYFVARRHGLETTLPFFIPVPFGFGTFGAIIHTRSPWENRKALFDVGLAGPLGGLVVAIPIFFVGLLLAPARPPTPGLMELGSPLALQWLENVVLWIRHIPEDHVLYANAMTFAAWFGVVVTGINLLPAGQLDGGHVAYAVLGRWARTVGVAVLVGLVLLGIFAWQGWFLWAALIFFFGWQHPQPLNALEPLGKRRVLIGFLVLVLWALLFAPTPYRT